MANKSAILAVRIIGDATKAIREMNILGNETSRFGGIASKIGGIAAAGIAAAGAAITGVTALGIKSAADLEQSTGAVETVFKGFAGDMNRNAYEASQALGLTTDTYNNLAVLLGTQLKNGMGGAAADMEMVGRQTHDLIGLGADLASMFGGTTKDAVEAISSALKGERDPIERYGISLKQAQIDAKAAELGFIKVGNSLDQEASNAATLALIMEQSADAHGNFAKETNTLAHQTEVAKAQLGNIVATLGTAFVPVLTSAATVVTGHFLPGLQSLVDTYAPPVAQFFQNLAPMVTPLISTLATLVTSGITPMGMAFQLLQPLLPVFMQMLSQLGQEFQNTVLPALISFHQTVMPPLVGMIQQMVPALAQIVGTVIGLAGHLINVLMPPLLGLIQAILPPLMQIIGALLPLIAAIVDALAPVIAIVVEIVAALTNSLMPVITLVATWIGDAVALIAGVVTGLINLVSGLLTGNWAKAWEGAKQIFNAVWNFICSFLGHAWKFIQDTIGNGLAAIGKWWSDTWNEITGFFGKVWETISSTAGNALGNLKHAISNGAWTVINFIAGIPEQAFNALRYFGDWLYNAGIDAIQGMINGIGAMGNYLWESLQNIVSDAVDGVLSFLGIHSPSTLFRDIGRNTGKGLILGIESMQNQTRRAFQDLANPSGIKTWTGELTSPRINPAPTQQGYTQAKTTPAAPQINITVNGALDPLGVASQIKQTLNTQAASYGMVRIG